MITLTSNNVLMVSGPTGIYYFEPVDDITPLELTECLKPLLLERADLIHLLPFAAMRHWRPEPNFRVD